MHMPTPSPPSLDLALIGNGALALLIDPSGAVAWGCWPRPDGHPVFSELLHGGPGQKCGRFRIELEDQVRTEQAYERNTPVLRTRLFDADGQGIEITDFAPRFEHHGRAFHPTQMVRRIRALSGRPRIRIVLQPHASLDGGAGCISRGSHHLRYAIANGTLRLNSNAPITYLAGGDWFTLHQPISLLLGPDETFDGDIEATARNFEERTIAHWRAWTHRLALPFDWQEAVIRAAITLKLCQFEETGAIIAAVTTSIPEAPDSGRNWDYRFCWLRDAVFVVRALNSLSEVGTMEAYLRWLHDVLRASKGRVLQPLYGIGLECNLPEAVVDGWPGYRRMGPVRLGNQAYEHIQHDVYGHAILGATQAFHDHRLARRADHDDFALFEAAGECAWKVHAEPDAGMWELRSRAQVHTTSALLCWAACDRLAKVARSLGLHERTQLWGARAGAIRARILQEAWSERRQAYVDVFGGETLDAGVLLMAEFGFIDSYDRRFLSTLNALEMHLCDGPHMRRYEAPDDFGVPQVAFNACSFWRIEALARVGRMDQARELFDALLALRNPAGLLSEDADIRTGELWGNLPQTYSMAGIVNCAMRLSRPWDQFV
jgi:GH15 family glucan-1,4-alpha-glucosidase